jgi:arylsulfatase
VSKEWIEKYRGRFDQGWDKLREETFARQKKLRVVPANAELTVRPDELPAWNSLSVDEKRLFARQMEVFAAFVAHTDHEIGRLLQVVKDVGRADNTMILFIIGDNGDEAASGGVKGSDMLFMDRSIKDQLQTMDELGSPLHIRNVYSAAWAWAGSTPFQWMKRMASHFGGTRNPLIVSWPSRITDSGGLRSQFTHVNDVAATLYEAAGIEFPRVVDGIEQLPLDGVSFADTFEHADAPDRHRVQYFEIRGNRAIYHDGWVAAARHEVPWIRETKTNSGFEADRWELYNIAEDFSQAHDVAARYPGKLKALQTLFDTEARKNDVYPLGAGSGAGPPSFSHGKREFVYYAGFPGLLTSGLEFESSHRIIADVEIPEKGAEGVIIAFGTREFGFTLYVKDRRLIYEKNVYGARNIVTARDLLPTGEVELSYEFIRTSDRSQYGGGGYLYVNRRKAGEVKITAQGPAIMPPAFMDIGQNFPSPVSQEYQAPFKFTGKIESVRVKVD